MSRWVATAPRGGGLHPGTLRAGPRHLPLGRRTADRRRPRPTPPPPLLWKRLERLEVPAWQARRVAHQTHRLPYAGARWVDEQLAGRTGCGPVIVDRLVAQAIAQFDPEDTREREDDAKDDSDVTLTHPEATDFAGTSHLEARGDTLTLKAFYDLVCALAHQLHLDGDPDPLGARKVKAIGMIVALATGPTTTSANRRSRSTSASTPPTSTSTQPAARPCAVGEIEKLGAATLTKIRHWVGHHQVVIQPVLNMARGDAVDVHDPPPWMRELVILRDSHCIFPRCTTDARSCDLDHITAYTKTAHPAKPDPNLAPLCRRHHRAKTSGRWRYTRTPDGTYIWHGPTTRLASSPPRAAFPCVAVEGSPPR